MNDYDVSIVIQGPINRVSLCNLDNYRKLGKVIVSCYNTCEVPELPSDVDVIQNEIPNRPFFNASNIFFQTLSSFYGAHKVDTQFTIKVRSDEYYTNLYPIIEALHLYPQKYVCNNIWVRKTSYTDGPHPSDHIIGMSTISMCFMFDIIKDICFRVGNQPSYDNIHGSWLGLRRWWQKTLVPETSLFLAYLKYYYPDLDELFDSMELKDIMYEHMHVVPIEKLGPFLWTVNFYGTRYDEETSDKLYTLTPDRPCVRSHEEI